VILPLSYVRIGLTSSTPSSQTQSVYVLPSGSLTKFTSIEAAWCSVRNVFFLSYMSDSPCILNTTNCLKHSHTDLHMACIRLIFVCQKSAISWSYKNTNHQQMHKESFIINCNTLLHVSTLLGHLQGEPFYRYTKVAFYR
jgi:cytochrome bd-type quinol oxidase subunit 1